MNLYVFIVLKLLNLSNFALHSVGTFILIRLYRSTYEKSHKIFLINHSTCECVRNLFEFTIGMFEVPYRLHQETGLKRENSIRFYLERILNSGICVVYYLSMVFLTLDRLAKLFLQNKYRLYWNERKTKYLLFLTWFLGLLTSLLTALTTIVVGLTWEEFFHKYVYPLSDCLFIIIAIATVVLFISSYRMNRIELVGTPKANRKYISRISTSPLPKRKTKDLENRYFLPISLIASYMLLIAIPDLIYYFIGVLHKNQSKLLKASVWITYSLANQVDACFYFVFVADIRLFFAEKFCPCLKKKSRKISRVGPAQLEGMVPSRNTNFLSVPFRTDSLEFCEVLELKKFVNCTKNC